MLKMQFLNANNPNIDCTNIVLLMNGAHHMAVEASFKNWFQGGGDTAQW